MKIQKHDTSADRILTWDDTFTFACNPGLDCYTACCRDITIFLNPLDVSSLRSALGITSTEFLEKYTVRLVAEATGIPAVVLKMNDDEKKSCPFVKEEGCQVYDARPYSCRLYPLDTEQGVEYKLIADSGRCLGLQESNKISVEQWRREQGLYPYDDIDHELKDVMAAEQVWEAPIREPRMQDMIYMALYDPDRFREFVFTSSFLQKFNVDNDIVDRIRNDDTALLYFAAQWLRFALFGKKGFLKIDSQYLDAKKKVVLNGK
jgi:Fe-S-cluster containining protein